MSNKAQYSAKQFIEAIHGSAGIISTIALKVGCSWQTAKHYIETHQTIKAAYDDEREKVLDMAESALLKAIKGDDLQAVKYYLSTVGKRRGYTERVETTGADGGPILITEIEVIKPPEDTG